MYPYIHIYIYIIYIYIYICIRILIYISLQNKTIKSNTVDQDHGCSDCMKRCDSYNNIVDHVSSFDNTL